jgi:hypothetical protein
LARRCISGPAAFAAIVVPYSDALVSRKRGEVNKMLNING